MAAQLYPGIVKAVLSGDTVIIMGADASKGPPPEKVLSLTGISRALDLRGLVSEARLP